MSRPEILGGCSFGEWCDIAMQEGFAPFIAGGGVVKAMMSDAMKDSAGVDRHTHICAGITRPRRNWRPTPEQWRTTLRREVETMRRLAAR